MIVTQYSKWTHHWKNVCGFCHPQRKKAPAIGRGFGVRNPSSSFAVQTIYSSSSCFCVIPRRQEPSGVPKIKSCSAGKARLRKLGFAEIYAPNGAAHTRVREVTHERFCVSPLLLRYTRYAVRPAASA